MSPDKISNNNSTSNNLNFEENFSGGFDQDTNQEVTELSSSIEQKSKRGEVTYSDYTSETQTPYPAPSLKHFCIF